MKNDLEAQETASLQEAVLPAEPNRSKRVLVLGSVAILLMALSMGWYLHSQGYEDTDDAQVDGHLNSVAARIDGTVKAVHADDNQTVTAGALLVELDPSDNMISLQQAEAHYHQAIAQLGAAHPNLPITRFSNVSDLSFQQAEVAGSEAALAAAQHDLDSAVAKLRESQILNERNQADLGRYQALFDKQEVAHADYDQYKATAAAQVQVVASNEAAVLSAQKTVEQRFAQVSQQRSKLHQTESNGPLQVAIREADIKTQQANADVEHAALAQSRLNLSYCRITAPIAGVVTQRSVEVGQRISKGEQLFMIVQTDDLWVTANFKETQLARIHPGLQVRIHVDALHGDFRGTVESMPAVTGSRTSVLPPENATGNYVKVIQRLPVRIRFDRGQTGLDKLRPGMSVEPRVHLE